MLSGCFNLDESPFLQVEEKISCGPIFDIYEDDDPIYDVYDNGELSMTILQEAIEKEFVVIRGKLHEEFKKMAYYWEEHAATWRKKIEKVKKPNQPAKQMEEMATDLKLSTESQPLVTPSFKRSATSPPKQDRRHHRTARARKLGKHSRSNLSKHGSRVRYTQPWEHDKLHGSPSPRWTFPILFHLLSSYVEEVLSLMDRIGINGKRPFDRGRVCSRTLRTRFFGGWSIDKIQVVGMGSYLRKWFSCISGVVNVF